MANHTPEPWHINKYGDIKANDAERCIPVTGVSIPMAGPRQEEGEANASRIVACVNACKGLPNEVLLKMASGEMDGSEIVELYKAQAQLATITAQRDELKDQSEYVLRECKEPEALNDESLNICNIATGIRDLRAELEEVIAQRDELLAAIKAISYECGGEYYIHVNSGQSFGPLPGIKQAIAKCEVKNG